MAETRTITGLASLVAAWAIALACGCSPGGAAGSPAGSASGGTSGATGGTLGGGATGGGGGVATNGSGGSGGSDTAGSGGAPSETDADSNSQDAAGAAGCHALFCESFEDVPAGSPPDPAIWTRTSEDLVVDVTDGALGTKKALHVPSIVNGFKYIREKKTIPAMGTKFYGRVWFRIDRRPLEKPNGLFHWTLLSADELDNYLQGKLIRFGGHIEADNTNWLRFNFQTHGNPGETGLDDKTYTLDIKKWYCVEFYFSLPDQEARIWMNGVERPLLHWLKSVPGYSFPASISQMSFGWAESHGIATPWEVWVDEIALDTKKIGCGN